MIDVVEQVIERHPKVKNEGIPETQTHFSKYAGKMTYSTVVASIHIAMSILRA